LLPWVYLFFNQSIEKKRGLFFTSFFLALTIYSGSIYVFVISSMALIIHGLITSLEQKTLRQILIAIKVIFGAVILASPKLLPMAEFLNQYRRTLILPSWAGFFNLDHIKAGILEMKHFFFAGDNIYRLGVFINDHVVGYNFDVASIFLLICSYFILWKKFKALVVMNIIFLLLALGDNSPFNIWRVFHSLFSSTRGAHKFFGGLIFSYSLTLGLSVGWFQEKFLKQKKAKNIFFFCMLFLVYYGVFSNASKIFSTEECIINYRLNPGKAEFTQSFEDNKLESTYDNTGNNQRLFESIYNNTGVVNAFDNIGVQIKRVVIARQEKDYKGEYFLKKGNGRVNEILFSPNRLVFKADLFSDDTLIINQNYFPGWHSTQGRVINSDGLLGVRLKKGEARLGLYYFPPSLAVGIILCTIFIFKRMVIRWKRMKKIY